MQMQECLARLGLCIQAAGRSTRHNPLMRPLHTSKTRWRGASASPSIMPPQAVRLTVPPLSGAWQLSVEAPNRRDSQLQEEPMTITPDR
jgi:hypothetical protein